MNNYLYQRIASLRQLKNVSLSKTVQHHLKRALYRSGLDVRKVKAPTEERATKSVSSESELQRCSLTGILQQAKQQEFSPATVIDVGAAYGLFSSTCNSIFQDARYILLEPLEEYTPYLRSVIRSIAPAEHVAAAVTNESGSVTINVHPDLVGSSLYKEEEENSDVNGVERIIPALTLDELCNNTNTRGPYLIKIDAQGAELDVLSGAKHILQETEFLILEISLFEFFKGGPQLYDVITFMKKLDFVVYDICNLQYRLLDRALSQLDVVFVRDTGQFRQFHVYASSEQRKRQDNAFREHAEESSQ